MFTRLLAADLVVGPKYAASCEPSCDSRSEGVGLGEMTRGVAGTLLRRDMVGEGNGSKAGREMTPVSSRRVRSLVNKEQTERGTGKKQERRCRSRRDCRCRVGLSDRLAAEEWSLDSEAAVVLQAIESRLAEKVCGRAIELYRIFRGGRGSD